MPQARAVSRWQAYVILARPATLPVAAAPVLVATALAVRADAAHTGAALAALLGAVAIQVGTNAVNDAADGVRGSDGERLGPPRAVASGWVTPRTAWWMAVAAFAVAAAAGVFLIVRGGWPIAVIGVAAIACGIAYTAGPWPLAYLGIADGFVFAFFGLVAVAGSFWVQALYLEPAVWWAGASLGFLATAVLAVNNLRDRHGDARHGKRTLAVRYGARFARGQYAALVLLAYVCVLLPAVLGGAPRGWLLAGLSLPWAVRALRGVVHADGAALNPWLAATARLELMVATLLAIGSLWPR